MRTRATRTFTYLDYTTTLSKYTMDSKKESRTPEISGRKWKISRNKVFQIRNYDYSQEVVKQEWGAEVYPGRTNWASHTDYVMAVLGLVLGVSSFSFFPFQCLKYGKVLFLVPYAVSMVLVAIPMMLLEIALGQYTSNSTLTCWKMAPIFKAIGVGMMVIAVPNATYFHMNAVWCLYYIYSTLVNIMGDLPWSGCDNDFNTPYCVLNLQPVNQSYCENLNMEARNNGVCYNETKPYGFWDKKIASENGENPGCPAIEYFNYYVLDIDVEDAFEKIEGIRWQMALLLSVTWFLVYVTNFYHLKTSAKIACAAVIVPPIVIVVLLGLFLYKSFESSVKGIEFFVSDLDWSILLDVEVWANAMRVVVYSSASIGGCVMIVLSSYSSFHNNILRDTMIIMFGDALLNVLGTILFFTIIGYRNLLGNIPEGLFQSSSNVGYGFIPQALSSLPLANFAVLIYFISIFLLAFTSQFLYVKCIVTSFLDVLPVLHRPRYSRSITALIVMAFCGVGLLMCTESGFYVYHFLEWYVSGANLLLVGFLESIGIAWIYGVQNFTHDIGIMMGNQKLFGFCWTFWSKYFIVCWVFVCPVLLCSIATWTYLQISPITYGDYEYPSLAGPLGLFVVAAAVLGILVTCACSIYRVKGSFSDRMRKNFTPEIFWGPAMVRHRVKVVHLKNFDIDPHWQGIVKLAHET